MRRTQKWPVAYGQRAHRAPAASGKRGSDQTLCCFAGAMATACVSSAPSVELSLADCNKHLLSERQRSMKIPLARQGSGWAVGGFA